MLVDLSRKALAAVLEAGDSRQRGYWPMGTMLVDVSRKALAAVLEAGDLRQRGYGQ